MWGLFGFGVLISWGLRFGVWVLGCGGVGFGAWSLGCRDVRNDEKSLH